MGQYITFNEIVKPIQYPEQKNSHWLDQSADEEVRVCGWGKISEKPPSQYPDTLHCVNVNLIDSSSCNRAEHYKGAVKDGMFCAGLLNEGGKDACSGQYN